MKLIEALMIHRGKAVKVGSDKGNAFIYCGRVDDKAVEVLDRYLNRNVVESFANAFGGINILFEGKETGKYWAAAECVGEDLEKTKSNLPRECCEDVVEAVYAKSAEEMAEAMIGLKADRERTENLRKEYEKALKKFDENLDATHVTKLLNLLGEAKRKLVPLEYLNICRKSKIETEEKFIKSGAYCINHTTGEAIADKIKSEVTQAVAFVDGFIASPARVAEACATLYVSEYVRMYCKEKGITYGISGDKIVLKKL